MTITITDQVLPTLLRLEARGRGFGLQAMNKAGAKSRSALERDTKSAGSHGLTQRFENGRRLLARGSKKLFSRYSKKTGRELPSLGRLTKWKLHPVSGVLLVGFIDTKPFNTYSYNGGKLTRVGREAGALTKSIADKIINGGRVRTTMKQRKFFKVSIGKRPRYLKFKAHPSVVNFGRYAGILNTEVGKAWSDALAQAKVA